MLEILSLCISINLLLFNHGKPYICCFEHNSSIFYSSPSKISNPLYLKCTYNHFLKLPWHVNYTSLMCLGLFFYNNQTIFCWFHCLRVITTLNFTNSFVIKHWSQFWFRMQSKFQCLMHYDLELLYRRLEMSYFKQSIAKIKST